MKFKKSTTFIVCAFIGLTSNFTWAVLEEVIITAQKREQSLQDVPVSVATVDHETIEKLSIVDAADLVLLVPTLNFEAADEARLFNFSIRGIGTRSFSIGVEPSVSTVIDGVVYSRIGSAFDTLGDLQQVEVLSGPQGTLFGKNSSAGVVSITTKKPNMQSFEGKFDVTLASDNEHQLGLTFTGPLTENTGYRLYLFDRGMDGNIDNVFGGANVNGVDSRGGRGKLQWDFSDDLSLLFIGDYSEKTALCCGQVPTDKDESRLDARFNLDTGNLQDISGGGVSGGNYAGVSSAQWIGVSGGDESNQIGSDIYQLDEQRSWGLSLQADWSYGDGYTLTSISSYREWQDVTQRDRDSSSANLSGLGVNEIAWMMGVTGLNETPTRAEVDAALSALDELSINGLSFADNGDGTYGANNSLELSETLTQEIRITSPAGGFMDYVAGVYYSDQSVRRDLTIAGKWNRTGGGISTNPIENIDPQTGLVRCSTAACYRYGDTSTTLDTENFSVFGHVNFHPTDSLTAFVGLRWINEDLTWKMDNVSGPYGNHFGHFTAENAVWANDPDYEIQVAEVVTDGNMNSAFTASYADMVAAGYVLSRAGTADYLSFNQKFDDEETIWKAGLQYDLSDTLMVYSSYGTGYKSQAVNADIFLFDSFDIFNSTDPETSEGYELGIKGSFESIRFDLTYYDIDFEGLHTDGSNGAGQRGATRLVGGDVTTDGVEANLTWAAMDALTIVLGYSHNNTEITEDAGRGSKGSPLALSPENKFTGSVNYDFDLGIYAANVFFSYTWTDEVFFSLNEARPRDDYAISNISFSLTPPSDDWTASFYVRNLTDEQYVSGIRSVSSTQGGGDTYSIPRDFERYYGASFSYRF